MHRQSFYYILAYFEMVYFRHFQTSVTLTLERVILYTIVYHSPTSIYVTNFVQIRKTFCGRTDIEIGFF